LPPESKRMDTDFCAYWQGDARSKYCRICAVVGSPCFNLWSKLCALAYKQKIFTNNIPGKAFGHKYRIESPNRERCYLRMLQGAESRFALPIEDFLYVTRTGKGGMYETPSKTRQYPFVHLLLEIIGAEPEGAKLIKEVRQEIPSKADIGDDSCEVEIPLEPPEHWKIETNVHSAEKNPRDKENKPKPTSTYELQSTGFERKNGKPPSKITNWKKIAIGLEKYTWIMHNFKRIDVSLDRKFQERFNEFYKMIRNEPGFYGAFYRKLEASKEGECPTYGEILDYFWIGFHRIEASFSSKLIATVNPNLPLLDRFVLENLGLKKAQPYENNRLEKTKKLYDDIKEWHANHLKTQQGRSQIAEFDRHFPNSCVTDTKKIDFILWQTR